MERNGYPVLPLISQPVEEIATRSTRLGAYSEIPESSPALTQHNNFNGIYQNNDIQEQAMVLHVVQIVLKLFDGVIHGRAIPVADLCPPRDSRLDAVPYIVIGDFHAELVYKVWPFRTRTDKTHIPV